MHRQIYKTNNAISALINLKELLAIQVTNSNLLETKLHPFYPSLSSISDKLSELGFYNISAKISPNQLQEIPYPAIAHLHKNNGHFVVLQKLEQNVLSYIDPEIGSVDETIDQFSKKWTGIVLLVETNKKSGEENYKEKRKAEKLSGLGQKGLFILIGLIMISPIAFVGFTLNLLIWFTKAFGGVLSILLLINQFNINNEWVKSICNLGKKADCNRVNNSPAAKLLGIGMAEIGTLYFAGGLIALFISFLIGASILPVLALLSLSALPYTFFSVYYQWRKVKVWCSICLGVMGLLWVEFLINAQTLNSIGSVQLITLAAATFGFLLPTIFWMAVRTPVVRSFRVMPLEKEVARFKKSDKIFNNLLQNEVAIMPANIEKEIEWGDADAPFCITLVTNPTCAPCANAHFISKDLLSQYEGKIKIRVRFAVNFEENVSNTVAKYIIASYLREPANANSILESWYKQKDKSIEGVETWKGDHPIGNPDRVKTEKLFQQQAMWFASSGISTTPTFFLGDKKLPEEYTFFDLKYLVGYWIGG